METKCCGTCKWHEIDLASTSPDWVCCNEESEFWSDYTAYADCCEEWDERT